MRRSGSRCSTLLASCLKTIRRADAPLATGTAVADNGRAALDAVKGLRVGEAGDLFGQAKRFSTLRTQCTDDRT